MYRLAAVLLALALSMLTTSPASANNAHDFYIPPKSLPGSPGQLIKAEHMILALGLPTANGQFPGTATRIMYRSNNTHGAPIAVTGTYIEPHIKWKGHGPRPLVTMAAGTQGQGDQCAPSKLLNQVIHYRFPLDLMTEYEVLFMDLLLAAGIAVVMTDYEGLGTPGMHTYVNRKAQGYAVLDAARAAVKLPNASVGPESPVLTWGYSQGGGASGAAAELQPSYAPDVNLVGGYVGGPTADLEAILEQVDGTGLTGVIGYAMNSMRTQYPEIQKLVDREANHAGLAMLEHVAKQCVGESFLRFGFAKTNVFTKTHESISEIMDRTPSAKKYVTEQRLGTVAPHVPVLIQHGTADDILPYTQARQLAADWCKRGGNVHLSTNLLPPILPGLAVNHAMPYLLGLNESLHFVTSTIAGHPPRNNC